ncbi:MAG: aminotransferase [Xanthomonadales bacterium]|nr:aminotransferase [Xanthomonadales bacterium]
MNYRETFPVIDRHTWLNHAAISPWPAAVGAAMRGFVEQNVAHGPLGYPKWLDTEQRLRKRGADLLGAAEDDLALVKNTSEGLSLIAAGLDWQPGDALVCCSGDFPSNLMPWHQLVPDFVDVREVPFDDRDPETGLIDSLSDDVRLLAVSSVRYDSGVRLDLDRLGRAAHEIGALVVVDAIQHLGALPLDVATAPVDFVVGGSHKWLLAPEGLALFWSRPSARNRLRTMQTGWRMWPDMFNFERSDWTRPESARRFEPGTLNMAGIHGLEASLELLQGIDPETRAGQLLDRTGWLIDGLERMPGVDIVTPVERGRRAGIVCFVPAGLDPDAVLKQLASRSIFAARRGRSVRLSPNFYTPEDQIARALEVIGGIIAHGAT